MSVLLGALLLGGLALAEEGPAVPCELDCEGESACLHDQATCLVDDERVREAISLLKQANEQAPGEGELVRLLAWAYLQRDNEYWAIGKLQAQVDAVPSDDLSRAWLLWLLLKDGDIGRARPLLDTAPEPGDRLDRARLELLRAALLDLEGDSEQAGEVLAHLVEVGSLYPEDRALLAELRHRVLEDRGEPLSVRVQGASGYASNVIESAPQDVGSGAAGVRSPQAPIAALDAVLRYEPWAGPRLRPTGELRAKGSTPFSEDAVGFTYATAGARAGLELGSADGTRARLMYAGELMGLRGDIDGAALDADWEPVEGGLVMEAHRGDLELDLTPGVQLFAGGGRRVYRELRRTHSEIDGGGAWVQPLGGGWNLTTVATGRYHPARHSGWDAWGLTGLTRVRAPLPGEHMFKLRGMVLWDRWPQFGLWEPTVERRDDLAVRLQAGPWTRPIRGWRFGLTYNLASRASNVDAYDYTDHRVLAEIRWQRSWNPTQPRAAELPEPWLALPYDLDQGDDQGLDRVQDLLRQEDSARRGSSCVD